ncbi:hypothetical protein I6I07_16425 [Achromobacter deleyi]|uniref:Uncharacterized protein n=1 Tax=Achromobacter deleyi TaxID=1353891 RepID=A0A7T4AYC7_9BURK|nr:hypothetical protein [Achromobacter deleyi]QQB32289.1 hypothetical protein I6I07_16425 [Achromobacter deleyi]
MKVARAAMLMSMAALCAGCADGTAIPTGNRHAPSLASAVRFYSDPPHAPYEVVGLVKAESSAGLTAQESISSNSTTAQFVEGRAILVK